MIHRACSACPDMHKFSAKFSGSCKGIVGVEYIDRLSVSVAAENFARTEKSRGSSWLRRSAGQPPGILVPVSCPTQDVLGGDAQVEPPLVSRSEQDILRAEGRARAGGPFTDECWRQTTRAVAQQMRRKPTQWEKNRVTLLLVTRIPTFLLKRRRNQLHNTEAANVWSI